MTPGTNPDDRPQSGYKPASILQRHLGAVVRIGVVAVVLGALVASSWRYVDEHLLTPVAPAGPVPVIGPGSKPIKEPPTQPGGMQVRDQDKIILNGNSARPKVEEILPSPPAPLPSPTPVTPTVQPPTATAIPSAAPPAGPLPAVEATPSRAAAPRLPSPTSAKVTVRPSTAAAVPSAVPPASRQPVVKVSPPQATALPPPRPAAAKSVSSSSKLVPRTSAEIEPPQLATHGWFVQLGAMRSPAAAQTEWGRLKHAQSDLLGSFSAYAVRVDRADTVFYRIEAGPLADATAASRLCRSLEQRRVACIVLRP